MTLPRGDLPVVIAGGGIGGLAAALALAKRGIASCVHERRPAFAEDGAGIQIGPNGVHALRQIGAADAISAIASVPRALIVHDGATGRVLTRLPLGDWIAKRHGAPYWTVQRPHLHAALLALASADPLITITTGSTIESYAETDSTVAALTSAGAQLAASALIAADGLWSSLRLAIGHSAQLLPTGKGAFRALIAADAARQWVAEPDHIHVWLSPGAHVVHYPTGATGEVALVVIADTAHTTSTWSSTASHDDVALAARGFDPSLTRLLGAAVSWRMWSLHVRAPSHTLARGRVALLGDAAHPVLPFLAQGGVLALEDGVVIARCIDEHRGDIPAGLRAYGDNRRKRAARVAAASMRNGQIYHLAGLLASARNAVLSGTPPHVLMSRLDWLYGWQDRPP